MNLHTHQPRTFEKAVADHVNAVERLFAPTVEHGVRSYSRLRDLPRILALHERELNDFSVAGCRHVIAKLTTCSQAMDDLARTGHWSYDLNRHLAIIIALRAELAWIGGAA